MLCIPRVEVGKNALTSPIRRGNDHRKHTNQGCSNQEEHAGVHTPQEQNTHGDHSDHQERAHVGLRQQQQTHHRHRSTHRQHSGEEVLFHIHLAHHVVGGVEQDPPLGQLGGLKIKETQTDPTACTIHRFTNERNQHHNQQHDRDHKDPRRDALPSVERNLKCQQGRYKCHEHRQGVTQQKVRGRETRPHAWIVWNGNRGGIHHDQAKHQQRKGDPHQGLIETLHMHGRRRRACELGAMHANRQGIHSSLWLRTQQTLEALRHALHERGFDSGAHVTHVIPPASATN